MSLGRASPPFSLPSPGTLHCKQASPPPHKPVQTNRTRPTGSGNASNGQRPPAHALLPGGHFWMPHRSPALPPVRTTWRPTALRRHARCFQPVLHRGWMGLKHKQAVLRKTRAGAASRESLVGTEVLEMERGLDNRHPKRAVPSCFTALRLRLLDSHFRPRSGSQERRGW